jgi:3'-phosphoadenosine 5'-phosphosulfate (PAPS) 3'-phosphatase
MLRKNHPHKNQVQRLIPIIFPLKQCSFGEENGWRSVEKSADYVWVLDPIDGTKSFITGTEYAIIL